MNTQDAIAAFLAKGGKVQTVATGATNGMSARDWRDATSDRGFSPANSTRGNPQRYKQDREISEERYRELVNDAFMSGGSAARDAFMSGGSAARDAEMSDRYRQNGVDRY